MARACVLVLVSVCVVGVGVGGFVHVCVPVCIVVNRTKNTYVQNTQLKGDLTYNQEV